MKKLISMMMSAIMVMSLLPFSTLTVSAANSCKLPIINTSINYTAIKADNTLWKMNTSKGVFEKIMDDVLFACSSSNVAASSNVFAVIKTDNSLWMWGNNRYGALGDGTKKSSTEAIKIMDDVISVSTNGYTTAAIKSDGSLYTWGYNGCGQLGDGTTNDSLSPIKIMSDVKYVEVSESGVQGNCAVIKKDNSLWIWGTNMANNLGFSHSGKYYERLIPEKLMDNVVKVDLGHACFSAIKQDNSLWIWKVSKEIVGDDYFKTYLTDADGYIIGKPHKYMEYVIDADAGYRHMAFVKKDCSLWMLGGYNGAGELGIGDNDTAIPPIKVLDEVKFLSCGEFRSAVVTKNGDYWIWGKFSNNIPTKIMNLNSGMTSENNYTYAGIFDYCIDDDGNAVITKIVNNDDTETISIPTEIDGYKVVAIDKYCIPDNANIKRITIPSTVMHIDENAFNGYDGIEIIYYFSTEDDWIEITDGIHYISDDTELVYVMDDVENTEISDYNKPEKKKDNNINFTNAIRDWEKEKNDWIDTLVKVVNNIKDDISVSNEEAINNNYEKTKERIDAMIADEGWYQSGSDRARDAAFRAVYDMIADWGEESISLDKVDPSSDVVDFSTRIVKNVINGMKNQTIEKDYGDYTVLITVSGISTGLFENPAFTGSVTVKHKNGKTFGPALINSTVDDTKQVMSDYMLQLKELEENTIEMAMETYVSDLISLADSKLPLDAIKEKLDSASEIINDTLEEKGLGNLNNFIGGVIDVIKSTKEVIELQNGGDTDALIRAVADLDSKLDFLSGESTTATSATLDWAYKNLKQKTKYLKEVTEAYIDGKEIPEYETTLDKIVGWFDKHIFQCPVDVYVYNENDELIGCVSDEQIFGDTEEIYVEKNGDTKTVYVAEGANVHFKLVGTDIGNLDYVSETYSENKVVGRTNFYGIELYDGKEITAETTDETAPNNCNEIILQSNGETINTTEYLKAADNASVLIEGNVVGSGTVVGTGWYARGDSVTLVASPDEGYVFKGWYDDGTPITFNANYTFCAKDFVEVTAKFEKYEENYSVSIPASESFKTIYDISADSDEDNVYFYVKELSEEANASKLNLYLAEYETSGKLSKLEIADIKADSNGTVIFTIPYPKLEDFKIMLWTNNITPVIDVLN